MAFFLPTLNKQYSTMCFVLFFFALNKGLRASHVLRVFIRGQAGSLDFWILVAFQNKRCTVNKCRQS